MSVRNEGRVQNDYMYFQKKDLVKGDGSSQNYWKQPRTRLEAQPSGVACRAVQNCSSPGVLFLRPQLIKKMPLVANALPILLIGKRSMSFFS